MAIPSKTFCVGCGAQYPKEFDSEKHDFRVLGTSPFAVEIRDNNWFINSNNKVFCPVCKDIIDFYANEVKCDSKGMCNKAAELLDLGRYEEALLVIYKALELNPDDADAWNIKGTALDKLGRSEEALQACDKLLELDPDNAVTWTKKGISLNKLGRSEEALQACDKALELNPDNSITWNIKGYALSGLGRSEEALRAYDKSLELNPDYSKVWNNKGDSLNDLGRYEEGLQACDKALELNSEFAESWNNKGNSLSNLGRYEEALQAYDKALGLNPDYTFAWSNKSVALIDLGRSDEALQACDKALELNPDYSNAWYNKGIALDNLGRSEEALQAYDKALQLHPDDANMDIPYTEDINIEELFDFALNNYDSFSLVWRAGLKFKDSAKNLLDELEPYLVSKRKRNSWPGTETIGQPSIIYTYNVNRQSIKIIRRVQSVWDFISPNYPEDIAFYKGKKIVFASVAHEKMAWYENA